MAAVDMEGYINKVRHHIVSKNTGTPPFVLADDYVLNRPPIVLPITSSTVMSMAMSTPPSTPLSTPTPTPTYTRISRFPPESIPPSSAFHYNSTPPISHIIGPILGVFVAIILLGGLFGYFFLRRHNAAKAGSRALQFQETNRSKTRRGWGTSLTYSWSTLGSSSSTYSAGIPPPVYTPKDTRQMTADTLVEPPPFRNNSLSSKKQYTPQLTFSPSTMADRFSNESMLQLAPEWSSFIMSTNNNSTTTTTNDNRSTHMNVEMNGNANTNTNTNIHTNAHSHPNFYTNTNPIPQEPILPPNPTFQR
ncbi:hypothetical protein BDF14DRAFT_1882585 [Spinellus fusiger]|nr:hypothetical protein BDF14DRAFT_1882585 [Spinellus fusiger]